jgi:hypothetical protein
MHDHSDFLEGDIVDDADGEATEPEGLEENAGGEDDRDLPLTKTKPCGCPDDEPRTKTKACGCPEDDEYADEG